MSCLIREEEAHRDNGGAGHWRHGRGLQGADDPQCGQGAQCPESRGGNQKSPLRSILLYEVYFWLKKYFLKAQRSIFVR